MFCYTFFIVKFRLSGEISAYQFIVKLIDKDNQLMITEWINNLNP